MSFTKWTLSTEFPVIERLRSVINGIRVTRQTADEEILRTAVVAVPDIESRIDECGKVWVRIEPVGRWLRELVTVQAERMY